MLTPEDAFALIRQHLPVAPEAPLPLAQCAGAVLRESIFAERDQPPFDRVAMDGIALSSAAVSGGRREFRIQAVQAAGQAAVELADVAHCIQIMTGAVLSPGCDAVVPVEQLSISNGNARLNDSLRIVAGQNVHRRGSDCRGGVQVLSPGTRLSAADIAVAATAGKARLNVSTTPIISVISTGTELVEPGEPLLPHQIRRSNVYGVLAALRQHGFARLADEHLPDDSAMLESRLRYHLDTHDVLILSGGVSMGKFDLVPGALARLGVREVFHRVAQRPGKPMWFGVSTAGKLVFALPGNPVSTLICLARYVLPALKLMLQEHIHAPQKIALQQAFMQKAPLSCFLPVQVVSDDNGQIKAQPRPTNGSGDFFSLLGTDGFVELPPGPHEVAAGALAPLYRWAPG
jgi:molybdopterin molybdotransferase